LALTTRHALKGDSLVGSEILVQVQGVPIQVDVLRLNRFFADFQRVRYRRVAFHGSGCDCRDRQSFRGCMQLHFKRSEYTPAGGETHRRGSGFRQARFLACRIDEIPLFASDICHTHT